MQVVELSPQLMTESSFAPFGEVFGAVAAADARQMIPTRFSHDGDVTLSVIWQPYAERRFSKMERHFGVTQGFVQLSGAPAVVCVAPATDQQDLKAIPAAQSVSAFRINPELGYLFHRGTWHSLDRYLLAEPSATFLIVNVAPNPTQIVDYASRRNELHADLDTSSADPLGQYDGEPVEFHINS